MKTTVTGRIVGHSYKAGLGTKRRHRNGNLGRSIREARRVFSVPIHKYRPNWRHISDLVDNLSASCQPRLAHAVGQLTDGDHRPDSRLVNVNSLQQQNPRGVAQWIGGHLKIHASTMQILRKNIHNAIKS